MTFDLLRNFFFDSDEVKVCYLSLHEQLLVLRFAGNYVSLC